MFKSPLSHTDLEFMGKTSSTLADPVPGKGLQVYGWSVEAANSRSGSVQSHHHPAPATQAAVQARASQAKADPVLGLWLRQVPPPVSIVTLQILSSGCPSKTPPSPAVTF